MNRFVRLIAFSLFCLLTACAGTATQDTPLTSMSSLSEEIDSIPVAVDIPISIIDENENPVVGCRIKFYTGDIDSIEQTPTYIPSFSDSYGRVIIRKEFSGARLGETYAVELTNRLTDATFDYYKAVPNSSIMLTVTEDILQNGAVVVLDAPTEVVADKAIVKVVVTKGQVPQPNMSISLVDSSVDKPNFEFPWGITNPDGSIVFSNVGKGDYLAVAKTLDGIGAGSVRFHADGTEADLNIDLKLE